MATEQTPQDPACENQTLKKPETLFVRQPVYDMRTTPIERLSGFLEQRQAHAQLHRTAHRSRRTEIV
jgi:hypothetical protein